MILNMAGGAGLNFSVRQYTATPTGSAAENTIGIVTSTAISDYALSATAPANPASGMVWIQTGVVGAYPFSASAAHTIMVYPIVAKQYISGAWVTVQAYTYQGGSWRQWYTYYFAEGTGVLVSFTGLATAGSSADFSRSDYILLIGQNSTYSTIGMRTTSAVNISQYSQIVFDVLMTSDSNGTLYCGVDQNQIGGYEVPTVNASPTKGSRQLVSVDVSGLNGNYYLYANDPADYSKTIYIYNIYGIMR